MSLPDIACFALPAPGIVPRVRCPCGGGGIFNGNLRSLGRERAFGVPELEKPIARLASRQVQVLPHFHGAALRFWQLSRSSKYTNFSNTTAALCPYDFRAGVGVAPPPSPVQPVADVSFSAKFACTAGAPMLKVDPTVCHATVEEQRRKEAPN